MVLSWPARIKDRSALREHFVHVIEVLPTILEVAGIHAPDYVDGTSETCRMILRMSASLIGPSGSSTFRLSINAVSMSLEGSCFSPEAAPGPFHHGIRGRGGTIC